MIVATDRLLFHTSLEVGFLVCNRSLKKADSNKQFHQRTLIQNTLGMIRLQGLPAEAEGSEEDCTESKLLKL